MTLSYEQAMEYIKNTYKFGSKPGLERIRKLMELLGNPQDSLKFVHVAGTNGKGSTCAFLSQILMSAGYKTGIFTSPYIQRFSERIKINNEEISNQDIALYVSDIKEKIDIMLKSSLDNPTEFEILTAMAFIHFKRYGCNICVLETGLGGAIDSTNIIKNKELAIITTISFDHIEYLGDTLEKIATIKTGIIIENIPVVTFPQQKEVYDIIESVCHTKNAQIIIPEFETLSPYEVLEDFSVFDYKCYRQLKTRLLGKFQTKNGTVAIEAANALAKKGYNITEKNIYEGIENAIWPGRFEIVNKKPVVIIDGAHNPQGVNALTENLSLINSGKEITFITGVLKDKDYKTMLNSIKHLGHRIYTITPNSPRALDAGLLGEYLNSQGYEATPCLNVKDALYNAIEGAGEDGIICIFGSLYFIGDALDYFTK